jgi:hypothetical protein
MKEAQRLGEPLHELAAYFLRALRCKHSRETELRCNRVKVAPRSVDRASRRLHAGPCSDGFREDTQFYGPEAGI